MIKRIVAGCRNYSNYAQAREFILDCINSFETDENLIFISGGCGGQMHWVNGLQQNSGIKPNATLRNGRNTAGRQVLKEIIKWQKSGI